MKLIPLRIEPIKSADLFKQVLENSPREPLSVDMMRRRCRVLDKLDGALVGAVILEDLDALTLSQALDIFPWAVANRDILRIIDDVKEAKPPEDKADG